MPLSDDRRAVLAVAATFGVNAGVIGSMLPRYPQIADRLGAGEAAFGLGLLGLGLGGLFGSVMMPRIVRLMGGLVGAIRVAAPVMLIGAVLATAAPSVLLFGLALALAGFADGVLDPAMNEVALGEQNRHGRSLMGRMHATWSGTTTTAVAVGTVLAALGVSPLIHVSIVAVVMAAVQFAAQPYLREKPVGQSIPTNATASTTPTAEGTPATHDAESLSAIGPAAEAAGSTGARSMRRPLAIGGGRTGILITVIALGIAAAWVETPPQDWSALLLARDLGAGPGLAGAGPLTFVAGVFLGRLVMDPAVDRWGGRRVALGSGTLSFVGMGSALLLTALLGSPAPLLVGLLVAGVGAAPAFPLMFNAADHAAERMGRPAGTGGSMVSASSRVGFLLAPVVVGLVAEQWGLLVALAITPIGGFLLANTLPRLFPATVAAAGAPRSG